MLVGVGIHRGPLQGWPEEYWPGYMNGNRIGHVTAAVYSPGLEMNIGCALVPIEHAGLETGLTLETPFGTVDAGVVRKPLVDPKKKDTKILRRLSGKKPVLLSAGFRQKRFDLRHVFKFAKQQPNAAVDHVQVCRRQL